MPVSPIAPSPRHHLPIDKAAVAGPSAPGPAQAGKILLEEISAQVIEPDLSKFTPNGEFENEAARKRSTLTAFMKAPGFRQLAFQTERALTEARFLDLPDKPILMPRRVADECLTKWGLISPETNPGRLDPSLYDLYSYGLPNLARAVAVSRALRTQTTAVDALSQGEIRQALRGLFAHGLTVCIPGIIQNIEEAWSSIANSLNPPNLADEINKRTLVAATEVLNEHVNRTFLRDPHFAGNQIHMVAALKNTLAGKYGLERVDDKYAVPWFAQKVQESSGNLLNLDLDKATAPQVLMRSLASDLMNQMRTRLHIEGSEDPYGNAGLVAGMAAKLGKQYAPCSVYTIGKFDPELGLPTQLSDSLAPLAISLLRQAQRQGLCQISETQVEIPRQGLPSLNLLIVGNMICSREKAGAEGGPDVLVPLTLEDLLPSASCWLKTQVTISEDAFDRHSLAETNLGLAALMEACQNSKGGIWASVWQSGQQKITANQANAFLDIMSVQTPELADLFGHGEINSADLHNLLITVAHTDTNTDPTTNTNKKIFNRIPTDAMETWLKGLKNRLGPDARKLDPMVALGKKMYTFKFTECIPLALAAARLGVQVKFPELSVAVWSPQLVEPMLSLALPEQKVPLREVMVRGALLELTSKEDDGQIDILDALAKKNACVFTNQGESWQQLLDIWGLPGDNLSKLLNWTATHATKPWPPQALSVLFKAIRNNNVPPETVQACLASPSLKLVGERQGTGPDLVRAQQDYKEVVNALLSQRNSESLKLGFQLIGTFKGAGFPPVDGAVLERALDVTVRSASFLDVIKFASQSKLIPKAIAKAKLEQICANTSVSDQDATRIAGYLVPDQFEQSDWGYTWDHTTNLINDILRQDKHQLAGLLLNRLVGREDMNKLDEHGFAKLHYCAMMNHHRLIPALVAAGADVNVKASFAHNRKTPLHYAMREKNQEAQRALIDLGADKHIRDFWLRKPGENRKLGALGRSKR